MARHEAMIKRASSSDMDLRDRREHCSVDPDLLTAIGVAPGQQVRIIRNDDEQALYTVRLAGPEASDGVVRMGLAGRRRLGTDEEFAGAIDSHVPDPALSERDAEEASELVERLRDDGRHRGLIVVAPHGGDIEPHTDDEAERVGACLVEHAVSSWRCKGWKRGGGAFDRWHITSTELNESSFPSLSSVMSRGFTYALAFHGFDDPGILIGGGASPGLKQEVLAAVERATDGSAIPVRIAQPDDRFGGDDPANIVNRLTANGVGGVQIEQGADARSVYWRAIADEVAAVFAARLASIPR